jgi:hypothetical protein
MPGRTGSRFAIDRPEGDGTRRDRRVEVLHERSNASPQAPVRSCKFEI